MYIYINKWYIKTLMNRTVAVARAARLLIRHIRTIYIPLHPTLIWQSCSLLRYNTFLFCSKTYSVGTLQIHPQCTHNLWFEKKGNVTFFFSEKYRFFLSRKKMFVYYMYMHVIVIGEVPYPDIFPPIKQPKSAE